MIKKSTIFDYLTQIMIIWGISVLSLCLFCSLFGEVAKQYSSMFQLGKTGVAVVTLMQYLLSSVIITSLRWLIFTDILIKRVSIVIRTVVMFVCVILLTGIFAAIFQWFPIDDIKSWIMFFVCFFVCSCISVVVSAIKEKSDNKKMQEALEHLKGE
ncbi:MAG: hypothetical protein HFJ03_05990 [Lachnospira sp.]|mgnify:FL=1|jgi:hypothetical protein|nr:hypothetical protein [Lachnospira sp.]